jgi:hypothetical protein
MNGGPHCRTNWTPAATTTTTLALQHLRQSDVQCVVQPTKGALSNGAPAHS